MPAENYVNFNHWVCRYSVKSKTAGHDYHDILITLALIIFIHFHAFASFF